MQLTLVPVHYAIKKKKADPYSKKKEKKKYITMASFIT